MKVYKFGGASVKSANAVRNVANVIRASHESELLVVISAMGKTTNALEEIVMGFLRGQNIADKIKALYEYHQEITKALFEDPAPTLAKIDECIEGIALCLVQNSEESIVYDQVVSLGEILSTQIVADFMGSQMPLKWLDAREYITTNETFREGKVDWEVTRPKIQSIKKFLIEGPVITQGFIGRAHSGLTTTLGREGSDYSAAIFATCLKAESVTIWKDVPGVMNADPKRIPTVTVFPELPFQEAAEMTYYGASVIHPKTIKPLANANIPLLVKNFDDPSLPGTLIHECKIHLIPPLIIFKESQCLISCKVIDYTFISEDQISVIFKTLSDHEVKLNLMQNSAITFSFCVDYRERKIKSLIESLSKSFEVYYNTGLTLITVKNYSKELSDEYRSKSGIVLEQISRSTLQLLIKGNDFSGYVQ